MIGEATAKKFADKYPASRRPLARFIEIVRAAQWRHMPDVKASFSTTDFDSADQTYIFDIGGNKYRLRASIDFQEQTFLIESVKKHDQYDRG